MHRCVLHLPGAATVLPVYLSLFPSRRQAILFPPVYGNRREWGATISVIISSHWTSFCDHSVHRPATNTVLYFQPSRTNYPTPWIGYIGPQATKRHWWQEDQY